MSWFQSNNYDNYYIDLSSSNPSYAFIPAILTYQQSTDYFYLSQSGSEIAVFYFISNDYRSDFFRDFFGVELYIYHSENKITMININDNGTFYQISGSFFNSNNLLINNIILSWTKLGNDLSGSSVNDYYGRNLSISGNGTVISIYSVNNENLSFNSGQVISYKFNGDNWAQIGQDLSGIRSGDNFGSNKSISLNYDGSILAIGSNNYAGDSGTATASGQVRIFEFNGTLWVQKGSNINGNLYGITNTGNFGVSVDLNYNGDYLVVGASGNDTLGTNRGSALVFQWNGVDWIQVGDIIHGDRDNSFFGEIVHINNSGDIIAVSARLDNQGGTNAGKAIVYQYNGTSWNKLGGNLIGGPNDNFGYDLALNATGNIIAVGARQENNGNGYVGVWELQGTAWIQKGSALEGLSYNSLFGFSVALDGSGNYLAIGSIWNDADTGNASDNRGSVRMYHWNGTDWEQMGSDFYGQASGDNLGFSTKLTDNGFVVAVSSPNNDTNFSNAGKVSVYQWTSTFVEPFIPNTELNDSLLYYIDPLNRSSYIGGGSLIYNLINNQPSTLNGSFTFIKEI